MSLFKKKLPQDDEVSGVSAPVEASEVTELPEAAGASNAPERAVKTAEKRHNSSRGAFSAVLVALSVVAVLVFNLLVAQIPAAKAQIDLTDTQIYNITDTSVDYLNAMGEDVALHVLANEAQVDARIVRFLEKYVSLSPRLSLEYIDPTVFPSILSTYGADVGTIVVTCAATGRQELVSLADIIGFDEMAYYMYQQTVEKDFDAEGLITSAIDGVLTDAGRKIYATTGHEEVALSADVEALFQKVHMSVNAVNLLTDGGIPSDCDLLILNTPSRDLANDELTMLQGYLAAGGQVIYTMSPQMETLPNFETLCADYGLTVAPGMIADTQNFYQNNPYLFFPTLDNAVDTAAGISSDATLLVFATHGMTVSEPVRDTVTVSPFLSTSEGGMAVMEDNTQIPGTYVVGAVATESVDDGITARLTVYGSDSLISSTITQSFSNVDNVKLFVDAAIVGFEDVASISVEPVSLAETTNTITTGGIWALLFIFVIPAALLLLGFLRWSRRRKL